FIIHILVHPAVYLTLIQGVRVHPVDGWEVSSVCKACVQSPEYLNDSKGCLGHRLGNISSWRGYGTDDGEGTDSVIRTVASDLTGSFIELRCTGTKIRWVSFVTRHFFQ